MSFFNGSLNDRLSLTAYDLAESARVIEMIGLGIAEGVSALGTMKSLYDIIREARNTSDPDKLRVTIDQMVDVALAAREQVYLLQQERNAAVAQVETLQAEAKRMIEFDERADQYEEKRFWPGTTVYVSKDAQPGEGGYKCFCANCFGEKRLAILQATGQTTGRNRHFLCPKCKTDHVIGG